MIFTDRHNQAELRFSRWQAWEISCLLIGFFVFYDTIYISIHKIFKAFQNNKDPPVKKKLAGQIGSFRSLNYEMVPFLEGKSENWFAPFNQV